jgi:RHS repeat-associated protein
MGGACAHRLGGVNTTPPVRFNGQPARALPSGTTQATVSLTPDEIATCRLSLQAGVAYGSMPIPFSATGSTAHSTVVAGLTNGGSYAFYIRCQDGAANANTDDFVIAFSVAQAADTTPPTVAITAPPAGGTVAGTVTVAATATDDVGVVGMQFLLDGGPLGAEILSPPYTLSWNTASASNSAHTLSALARDAAGHATTSAVSSVTVGNVAGVVTYYHTDALGSVRRITDAGGQLVARYDYRPFGEPWNLPENPDRRQFVGKERDAETGFDYLGARYYASQTGRFTTVDPVLNIETALTDPQRWNLYV